MLKLHERERKREGRGGREGKRERETERERERERESKKVRERVGVMVSGWEFCTFVAMVCFSHVSVTRLEVHWSVR